MKDKDQLALIGRFSSIKNAKAYEESQRKVRIFFEDSSFDGKFLDYVEEMGYEVEKINGYANKEKKNGYWKEYISGLEIVAKPKE